MPTSNLRVYLNDHVAGSVAGTETAKALESGAPPALRAVLSRFLSELREEQQQLRAVMGALELPVNRFKVATAWLDEKALYLKVRRLDRHAEPFERFLRLEALCLGVHGKRCLWRMLEGLAPADVRLQPFDFRHLQEQAERQQTELEHFRVQFGAQALAGAVRSHPHSEPTHA